MVQLVVLKSLSNNVLFYIALVLRRFAQEVSNLDNIVGKL